MMSGPLRPRALIIRVMDESASVLSLSGRAGHGGHGGVDSNVLTAVHPDPWRSEGQLGTFSCSPV